MDNSAFQLQPGALYAETDCRTTHPPVGPNTPGGGGGGGGGGGQPPSIPPGPGSSIYPCRYTLTYEKVAGATYGSTHRYVLRLKREEICTK